MGWRWEATIGREFSPLTAAAFGLPFTPTWGFPTPTAPFFNPIFPWTNLTSPPPFGLKRAAAAGVRGVCGVVRGAGVGVVVGVGGLVGGVLKTGTTGVETGAWSGQNNERRKKKWKKKNENKKKTIKTIRKKSKKKVQKRREKVLGKKYYIMSHYFEYSMCRWLFVLWRFPPQEDS